jgi:hypothetical protein
MPDPHTRATRTDEHHTRTTNATPVQRMPKAVHELTRESLGLVFPRFVTRLDLFPRFRVEFMIFASDSHDLGWLALGIRPIPAFGHGCPGGWWGVSKYSRIPNLVKF